MYNIAHTVTVGVAGNNSNDALGLALKCKRSV